ncbi:ATP-binding cassette domain-containing protein [uncultured Muriicola sp.]|uniref:ATP-binding cassette domain-containing protein n=1 Tax=uncultured Muriicola sp. TaxID=1583102 RepID=UPI0026110620|nr:ATP-binding cassette domain-containing protein [uncultured Muriicola sp.]
MINLSFQKHLKTTDGSFELSIDLDIPKGTFVTLYGPSGAGKTSFLRMLAGLLVPDKGSILVNDIPWYHTERKINISPQKRNIGYVFQDYALFPNMTVKENLKFAQRKGQTKDLIPELMEVMELSTLENRTPDTLSGGQKQRAALARALVQQPDILLLDEPLAALDAQISTKLQDYILQAHNNYGLTTILVSHDLGEIMKLTDTVVVMEQGRITKIGMPQEIFMNKKLSGKFQFTGTVLSIEQQDVIYIVTVLIYTTIIKVVADASEIKDLHNGDSVVVASKAFNPVIYKVSEGA